MYTTVFTGGKWNEQLVVGYKMGLIACVLDQWGLLECLGWLLRW